MGGGAEVQPNHVVHARLHYKNVILEHDLAVIERAHRTFLLGNEFCFMSEFMVDQQRPEIYLKMELDAVGLTTTKSPSLGKENGNPAKLVTKIHITRKQVVMPHFTAREE